jgi:hypothetical protein
LCLQVSQQYDIDPIKANELLKEYGGYANIQADRWYYKRPDWLYPHQENFINIMRRGNCFVVGARQFTGKTTGTHVAAFEELWDNPGYSILLIAPTSPITKNLFQKIYNDEHLFDIYKHAIKSDLKESVRLTTNSVLDTGVCNASSLSGRTINVVWIDEIHKIIEEKEGREALAFLLPAVLKTMLDGKGKVWITCNMSNNRMFHAIMTILKKYGMWFPVCSITEPSQQQPIRQLVIENESIPAPDLSSPEAKEVFIKRFTADLQTSLMDAEFAKAQLENLADFSKDPFPPDLIERAFGPGSFDQHACVDVEAYIDPGFEHATGFIILGRDTAGNVHELYSDEFYGGQISEDALKAMIADKCIKMHVQRLWVENNSGGLWWMQHFNALGIATMSTGFGTANPKTGDTNVAKFLERGWYNRVLKHLLEAGKLRLHNPKLKQEWLLYDSTGADKETGKGDLMDCLLQCAFYVAGGTSYLQDIANEQQKELGLIDDGAYSPLGD